MALEQRTLICPVEVHSTGKGSTAAGYAALFGVEANIGGHFREIIAPGTFAEAVKGDVLALYDHDMGRVLGRSSAGTLRMTEDATGLAVEIDLPDTSDGRDLAVLMERGDISGMSFGFSVTKETWDETSSLPLRTIQAVDLIEVSAVARPAYPDTSIAMRSLEGVRQIAKSRNFNAAANRVGMKVSIDLRLRGLMSKA